MMAQKLATAQSRQAVRRQGEHHTTASLGRGARHGGCGSGAAAAPPLPAPTCQACSEMCWPSAPASRGWGWGSAPGLGTCQAVPPSPRSPAVPPVTTAPLSVLPAPRTGRRGSCTLPASPMAGLQDGVKQDVPAAPGPPYGSGSAWVLQTHHEMPLGKRGSAIPILIWILSPRGRPFCQPHTSHRFQRPSPFIARFDLAPPNTHTEKSTTTKAHPPGHCHGGPAARVRPRGHSALGEPARAQPEPCHS